MKRMELGWLALAAGLAAFLVAACAPQAKRAVSAERPQIAMMQSQL